MAVWVPTCGKNRQNVRVENRWKYGGYKKSNSRKLIVQLWNLTGCWYAKRHLAFYKLTKRLVEIKKFFSLALSDKTKT
jgi:hypothetical protein